MKDRPAARRRVATLAFNTRDLLGLLARAGYLDARYAGPGVDVLQVRPGDPLPESFAVVLGGDGLGDLGHPYAGCLRHEPVDLSGAPEDTPPLKGCVVGTSWDKAPDPVTAYLDALAALSRAALAAWAAFGDIRHCEVSRRLGPPSDHLATLARG